MNRKTAGIALMILSAVLLGAAVVSVMQNVPHDGQWAGAITQYRPPFYGHGLLVIALGVGSLVSFLGGSILVVVHKMNG